MADTGFLNDGWRDCLAVFGVIGTLASIAGVIYAIVQIKKTKAVADAIKTVTTNMRTATKEDYHRYVVSNAVRCIGEAKAFVEGECWLQASLRLTDIAHQLSQLANIVHDDTAARQTWLRLSEDLHQWSANCQKVASTKQRFQTRKWTSFVLDLEKTLHRFYGPFTVQFKAGQHDPNP